MSFRAYRLAVTTSLIVLLTATAPALGAGPEYMNFWTTSFSEVDESCSGELVEVTGTLRHHVVFVNDGSGGFHGNGIFVGTASGTSEGGTQYVAGFTDQLSQYFAPGDGGAIGSAPFSFRLISTDGTENLSVRGTFHITLNAAGEVVVFRSELSFVCR